MPQSSTYPSPNPSSNSRTPSPNSFEIADSMLATNCAAATAAPMLAVAAGQSDAGAVENDNSNQQQSSTVDEESACKTFICVGGTWTGGSELGCFQPCKQKKMAHGLRHARSQVCTVHHDFIKCESCPVHVHEGCFVRSSNGYSLPKRGFPWMCMECTLAAAAAATA